MPIEDYLCNNVNPGEEVLARVVVYPQHLIIKVYHYFCIHL